MIKNNFFEFRLAELSDLDACMKVLSQGRAYQQSQGFTQWPDGYPAEADVKQDILNRRGYILKVLENMGAYFYIDFQDPSYDDIVGTWHSQEPYMVIHRVAIADNFRGAGISDMLFQIFEALARNHDIYTLRIDTHPQNIPMQRVLARNGYTYCGTVMQDNGLRWAYDKLLTR